MLFRAVPEVFRAVPGCSGGVPGCSGLFRTVPVFRISVPGFSTCRYYVLNFHIGEVTIMIITKRNALCVIAVMNDS